MPASILAPRDNVAAGIGYMLAAIFCFISLDTVAKYLLQIYPPSQVMWARFFFHLLLAMAVMGPGLVTGTRSAKPSLQLARSILILATTTLFFLGLKTVPLATATTIMFLTPIFVTVLSVPLLGEKVGGRRWLGVLTGFAGALVVVRPGFEAVSVGVILLLVASLTNAVYQSFTRRIRHDDGPATTFFYTAVAGAAAFSAAAPFHWQSPGAIDWLLLAGLGLFGGLGHLLLIHALRLAPAAVVAPFTYTGLVWATLFGVALLGEVPDLWTMLGASLIIGSGLYIFQRERRLSGDVPQPA